MEDRLLAVDNDAAATDRRRGTGGFRIANLVVINEVVGGIRDLDPELVDASAPRDLTIVRSEQELEARNSVHRAFALVLGPGSGDHEPLIARALEIETGGLELELGVTGRDGCAFLIP